MRQMSVERLLQWAYADAQVRGLPSRPFDDDVLGDLVAATTVKAELSEEAFMKAMTEVSDAQRIDMFVSQLSRQSRGLVRDHAMARTRPDCKANARYRMAPMRWLERHGVRFPLVLDSHPDTCRCGGVAHVCEGKPGNVVVWGKRPRGWDPEFAYPPEYTPIVEVDRPNEVTHVREEFYVRWWSAVQVIRDHVRSGELPLVNHSVTNELPPQFPWVRKISVDGEITPTYECATSEAVRA